MASASPPPENASPKKAPDDHGTLKYQLLGPSLTKAGQNSVDQTKVSEIIYNASKGSKFFDREEARDRILTEKIGHILAKKARLETRDPSRELRAADALLAQLEQSRDLSQTIVHVDCDAFYCAVEQLDRPELAQRPFAVGQGVLTTCNYVARTFGCRSGMAGFVAKKLCPEILLLPLNFDKYRAKAEEVREILARFDPEFESASIDEAYLNITDYLAEHGLGAAEAVEQLRREVHEHTRITVSAGVAANARLAKICSNVNKPNGQFVLPPERAAVLSFVHALPPRKVNGIGRVLERELAAVGIATLADAYPNRHLLHPLFGDKAAEFLLSCYLGLGRTRVHPAEEYERKSVGTESTFAEMDDPARLREKLRRTAEDLEVDLARAECRGRTLCLKVKLHTYEVYTRQVVLHGAVAKADDLYRHALPMLVRLEQENPRLRLRLMGLRCTHLSSTKKVDTMAFFGFRARPKSTDGGGKRKLDDMLRGDAGGDVPEWQDDMDRLLDAEVLEQERKAVDTDPANGKEESAEEEERWDCPVCLRPQAADERTFNAHIDTCLSRQTIRDAVHEHEEQAPSAASRNALENASAASTPSTAASAAASGIASKALSRTASTAPSRGKTTARRGRPRGKTSTDPRQKKLCFG